MTWPAGFLVDEPAIPARWTLLLAHGAGAPMDSAVMTGFAGHAAAAGLRVVRFEFPFMAAARSGRRRPPPRAEALIPFYAETMAAVLAATAQPLLIAGKSLGGRVAAMAAAVPDLDRRVAGVVCLGYPFHPSKKPQQLRLTPLVESRRPVLVLQGTRDPLGNRTEVESYALPAHVRVIWFEGADHDLALGKRGRADPESRPPDALTAAADHVAAFAEEIAAAPESAPDR